MNISEFFDRLWVIVLGYDIFVSYRQSEASSHAEELARQLGRVGLVCFLDREQTAAGVKLTRSLRAALRRSGAMVCVLTPGVTQSEWIRQEVTHFLRRPQCLWPINIGGILSKPEFSEDPFVKLRQRSWLNDTREAVAAGSPSAGVVRQIRASYNRARVRMIGMVLSLFFAVVLFGGGGGLIQYWRDQRRRNGIAYTELRPDLIGIEKVLRILVRESQQQSKTPSKLPQTLPDGFFRSPEVVASLERLNLLDQHLRAPVGPLLGFRRSPTGHGMNLPRIIAGEMADIVVDIDRMRRLDLPLADKEVLKLAGEIAVHSFATRLAKGDFHSRRYSQIEDTERLPYYLLAGPGRPGLCQTKDYVDFVEKLEHCLKLVK